MLTTADRFSVDFPPDIGDHSLSILKDFDDGNSDDCTSDDVNSDNVNSDNDNSDNVNKGVEMKATLLAVTFLIDYLHFEADPGDSDGDED